jgi:hypothetical protein
MFNLKPRRTQGFSLAFSACLILVITIIGVALFWLLRMFGGSRELQNAADAGSLNVAKQALTSPAVSLSGDVETTNFSGLTDSNGKIDLLTYNRVFGQMLLVAINAQTEKTQQALQNANTLAAAVYAPQGSLSQRLRDSLQSWTSASDNFQGLAKSNSTRMLPNSSVSGNAATYLAAYADPGSPTNLYLDTSILPANYQLPNNLFSNTKSKTSGLPYINGYLDVTLADPLGKLPDIAGATVNPLQQPHLISQTSFHKALNNPVNAGAVPPNSFQAAGAAQASLGNKLMNIACGEVGTLTKDFPACIPHGYLVVSNQTGIPITNMPLPSNESIFNNQLFTGIFIGNNGAFSTDESQILAWANYNNNGQTGVAPSTDGLFNVNGAPVNGEQYKITGLGGDGYPVMADYTNVQGPNENPAAAAMLPAFESAYPASNSGTAADGTFTAVEDLKAQVISAFIAAADQQLTSFTPAPISSTGMRAFSHTQAYPVGAGKSPEFTEPGNIAQLCAQSDLNNDPTGVCNQLRQRMKEIKPSVTDAEVFALLGLDSTGKKPLPNSAQTINMGETWYIYLQNNIFVMTQNMPPWVTTVPTPDGNAVSDATNFPTIGLSVDPVGEEGFNQTLFAVQPDPSTSFLGVDTSVWTPSSGFNNLLGTLAFNETISTTTLCTNGNSQQVKSFLAQFSGVANDGGPDEYGYFLSQTGTSIPPSSTNGAWNYYSPAAVAAGLMAIPGVTSVSFPGYPSPDGTAVPNVVSVTLSSCNPCSNCGITTYFSCVN